MKKIQLFLLVMLIAGCSVAQQHRTKDVGILFGIGNDFLSPPVNILENGIGLMIHMENFALRPTLQFGKISQDNGSESSAGIFGLGAALIWHLNENRIAPYYGAGFNYTSSKQENSTEYSESEFMLYGLFGVDLFVYKNVTLGAEYHLGYLKNSYKIEYPHGSDSKASTSSFGFSTVRMILTIFFM